MLLDKIVHFLCHLEIKLFFKDFKVVGVENIPKKGGIILYGNHGNLFFDAIAMSAFSSRRPKFLVAEVTHKQAIMGFFSRNLNHIPVKRPLDSSKKGSGYIKFISSTQVEGIGTKFTSESQVRGSLYINHKMTQTKIERIESDSKLFLRAPGQKEYEEGKEYPYKILRNLSYKETFSAVWDSLNEENSICIYPEGASHDQTQLIPLKQGIAICALGAMNTYPELEINLVPVGHKYFKPHQFRSKAILEFGEPFKIDRSIIAEFKQNPQKAIEKAMKIIQNRLERVMLIAPSYKELEAIIMARSLYLPLSDDNQQVDPVVLNEAYKKFELFYNEFYTDQEVQELFSEIKDYVKRLRVINIKDSEVRNTKPIPTLKLIKNTLYSLFMLLFTLTFNILGLVLLAPLGFLMNREAEKKRINTLKSTDTRVKGYDVMASQKLLVQLVFYPLQSFIIYLFVFAFCWLQLEASFISSVFLSGALLVLWTVYSYLCIISLDTLLHHYRLLRFRIIAVLCRNDLKLVKKMRDVLKTQLEELIKKKKIDDLLKYREQDEEGEESEMQRADEEWFRGLEAQEFFELVKQS